MFSTFATIFKYKEKKSPDILGKYPEFVHVSAMPERRYLWTSRILVILACISICFNMMLSSIIYVLIPQREAKPRLFNINRYFSTLEIMQPDEMKIKVSDLIVEEHIREYITYRYVVTDDYDELMQRWGEMGNLYLYSSPEVFRRFKDDDVKLNIMQFKQKNMRRGIEIDWIRTLGTGLWQVQFKTMDYTPEVDEPDVNIWRAVLRVAFVEMNFANKNINISNPFGFVVTNYSLGYVGKPGSPASYMEHIKDRSEAYYNKY